MASKKSATKKTATTKPVKIEADTKKVTATETIKPKKSHKALWITGAVIIILMALAYQFKNQFIVVMVNGKPIMRMAYIKALEAQNGKATLQQMITEKLILDEAAKKNVTVPQADIDQYIQKVAKDLQSQGKTLDQELASEGLTMAEVQQKVKINQLVKALTANQVQVTDADVQKYMADNKASLPTGKDAPANLNETIKQQLLQTKQQEFLNTFLENLQKQAQIQYW